MTNDLSNGRMASAFSHLDPNESLGDGIAGGFASIGYRGKAWTLNYRGSKYPFLREDDGTPLVYLDVVIIGATRGLSKTYFQAGEWSEDSASGPVCTSLHGDVPDPGAPIPQNKNCTTCRHNVFGTGSNGKGKACQDNKRLAVLLMPKTTAKMLGAPLTEPVFFKVPPASLTPLKTYGESLTHRGFNFSSVVTRIGFAPDRIFHMEFKLQQALTNAEADRVLPMREDPQTMRILGVGGQVRLAAPKSQEDEPIDTGIMGTFGQDESPQETKRRGRPPGTPNKPKQIEAEAITPEASAQPAPWEESSDELDETVKNLLEKTSSMMK